MDDIRSTGSSNHLCERVCHIISSRSNYLGEQDAPRKRRTPSRSPGLCNGSLIITDGGNVFVSTLVEKWCKGKNIIDRCIQVYNILMRQEKMTHH